MAGTDLIQPRNDSNNINSSRSSSSNNNNKNSNSNNSGSVDNGAKNTTVPQRTRKLNPDGLGVTASHNSNHSNSGSGGSVSSHSSPNTSPNVATRRGHPTLPRISEDNCYDTGGSGGSALLGTQNSRPSRSNSSNNNNNNNSGTSVSSSSPTPDSSSLSLPKPAQRKSSSSSSFASFAGANATQGGMSGHHNSNGGDLGPTPKKALRRLSTLSDKSEAVESVHSAQATPGADAAASHAASFGLGSLSPMPLKAIGTAASVNGESIDDSASQRSGSARSDGSGMSGSSGTSTMIVNSFAMIDKYVRRAVGLSKLTGVGELLNDPSAETLALFKTRFETLFVVLDAAIRMSNFPFVVMTPDCTVILSSPTVEGLLGYTPEELFGNNINTIMPHAIAERHDDIVARYVDSIAAGETERASSVVYNTRPVTAKAKDGTPVSVELTVRPIMSTDSQDDEADAVSAGGGGGCPVAGHGAAGGAKREVILFVAQLRDARAEIALRNLVKESELLQAQFPFPYVEASETMTILKFNPAASAAFGLAAERAVGKNVSILMPKYLRRPGTKKRVRSVDHDKIVRNYVSKVRSVGEANVTSLIVGQKTRHTAQRINLTDNKSITPEPFPMELEVRMVLSVDGSIKFQAFARDCENFLNAQEAENAILRQTFPEPVADALISGYDVNGECDLGVIFLDIVGFTSLSRLISDSAALKVLDGLFTRYSNLRTRYPYMDPIKTNYDEFMCVTGLSRKFPGRNIADDAVRVAEAIHAATVTFNEETSSNIDIRVGIDCGISQVGLVGSAGLKTFDIIGSTSVCASRCESTCTPGKIHITENTYARLSNNFREKFNPTKDLTFKNMGAVRTYMSKDGRSMG